LDDAATDVGGVFDTDATDIADVFDAEDVTDIPGVFDAEVGGTAPAPCHNAQPQIPSPTLCQDDVSSPADES